MGSRIKESNLQTQLSIIKSSLVKSFKTKDSFSDQVNTVKIIVEPEITENRDDISKFTDSSFDDREQ